MITPARPALSKSRDFFTRPLVERVAQLDQQIRQHGDALHAITNDSLARVERLVTERLNAVQTEVAHLTNEGISKQVTQLNALRAELAQVTDEGFAKQATQLNALRAELARVTNEGLVKQGAQVDAVLRAIKEQPSREEFLAAGTRLGSLEQALVKFEQLTAKLHEKVDIVANRFLLPVDDDTVLVRSFLGYLYCSRDDHAVLTGLIEGGEFEPGLRRLLERVLEPGMVFLDVGAHLGLHTIAAARRVGKSGHVFAFEPTPVPARTASDGHDLRSTVAPPAGAVRPAEAGFAMSPDSQRLVFVATGADSVSRILSGTLMPRRRTRCPARTAQGLPSGRPTAGRWASSRRAGCIASRSMGPPRVCFVACQVVRRAVPGARAA